MGGLPSALPRIRTVSRRFVAYSVLAGPAFMPGSIDNRRGAHSVMQNSSAGSGRYSIARGKHMGIEKAGRPSDAKASPVASIVWRVYGASMGFGQSGAVVS